MTAAEAQIVNIEFRSHHVKRFNDMSDCTTVTLNHHHRDSGDAGDAGGGREKSEDGLDPLAGLVWVPFNDWSSLPLQHPDMFVVYCR